LPPKKNFLIRDSYYNKESNDKSKTKKIVVNSYRVDLKPDEKLKIYDDDFQYKEMPVVEEEVNILMNSHEDFFSKMKSKLKDEFKLKTQEEKDKEKQYKVDQFEARQKKREFIKSTSERTPFELNVLKKA
jgi:hypothetical protein